MSKLNPVYENQRAIVGGKCGTWVPVSTEEIPDAISTDPNKPTVDTEGNIYYADPYVPVTAQDKGPTPISANMCNAIPTPSPIVQLPPIVQPISLVPYASQNQPLVQYEPSYRPPVEETRTPEPVYRRKPFVGISAGVSVISLLVIIIACFFTLFGEYSLVSGALHLVEADVLTSLLDGKADQTAIFEVVLIACYGLVTICSIVAMINALVKIGKLKPLAKANGWVIAALVLTVAAIVVSMLFAKVNVGYGVYVIAVLLLVSVLMTAIGIKKDEQVIDYAASKQTFTIE